MFDFHKTVFIHAILHNKMPKCKKITRIHEKNTTKVVFQFNEKVFRLRLYQSIRVVYCAPSVAPQFFNAILDWGPREVALCVNLFTTTQCVQTITPQMQSFCGDPEKTCLGPKCRRTIVRQGYEPKTGTKKRTFSRPF